MKIEFIPKSFQSHNMKIIEAADRICQEYASNGYDLSLRQLYYQFVARGLLENSEHSYKRLGGIISDARLAGLIDWEHIKDRGRSMIENTHWQNPAEIIKAAAEGYRIDLWATQPNFVMVMVEKQALEGVLLPVCRIFDIPFMANKGYASLSAMYKIGDLIDGMVVDEKRIPHIIYLGDHDPSGIDMTRDVEDRLRMLAFQPREFHVHRVALDMDQIEEYDPPENPTKLTDSRASSYIDRFGYSSWELDALEPSVLIQIVTDKVTELRDDDLFEKQIRKQTRHRNKLLKIAASM